ncbi:hypothetical protein MNAB215_1102, partial [Mycobacterium numidiamassiliense]
LSDQPPSYPPPPPGGYPPPPGPGYPPPPGPGYPPSQPASGTNTFAIVSLVASLLGWICVGVGSVVGVVFGFLALNQIKQTGQSGRGLAIAGIVIGIISIVGGIIYWIIVMITAGSNTQVNTSTPPAVVITVDQQSPMAAVAA